MKKSSIGNDSDDGDFPVGSSPCEVTSRGTTGYNASRKGGSSLRIGFVVEPGIYEGTDHSTCTCPNGCSDRPPAPAHLGEAKYRYRGAWDLNPPFRIGLAVRCFLNLDDEGRRANRENSRFDIRSIGKNHRYPPPPDNLLQFAPLEVPSFVVRS